VIEDSSGVFEYSGIIPWYPSYIPFIPSVVTLLDLDSKLKKLDSLANEIDTKEPWAHKQAKEFDRMTVDEWARKNCWTTSTLQAIEAASGMIMGQDTCEVSFLYFLYYIKSAGGIMKLLDVKGGAQEERLKGGTQQLSEGLGKIIGLKNIKLNSPARKIVHKDNQVIVHSDSGTYQSKYVVVAIPPVLAGKIDYSPNLPSLRTTLTNRMPMGSVIKTLVFYKKAFWRERGYSGQVVSASHDPQHPIMASFDDTDHEGAYPCIVGFINGSSARNWATATEEERKKAICQQYADQMKQKEFLEPIHYIEKNWINEEWSAGCYVGVMPPGALTSCGKGLREPVGRIFFAGTETAMVWTGYMEGALESGERVAETLKAKL